MKTVNSLSGGKTSSYMAVHYPADYNVFALVTTLDKKCIYPDAKIRQIVSDKIGKEFIGTAEMDDIIYTILDLEQFTGQSIDWVSGESFESIIKNAGNYLPNKMARFCTVKMKLEPIFEYLKNNIELPCEMRIGFRTTELSRAETVMQRADENGIEHFETIIGKRKTQNKWGKLPYRKVKFPLIENNITKDVIYNFWNGKPVRFAYRNNCVGCVNRQPLMISHMASKDRNKVEWFNKQEKLTGNSFINGVTFDQILKFNSQGLLFNDDDFSDCDSGDCGI